MENGTYNLPTESLLPNTNILAPYIMLGDEGYPLRSYLMRPYHGSNLSEDQAYFNKRLSRARCKVECAFGILTAKWGCFQKSLQVETNNAKKIIKAACLLVNIIIDCEGHTLKASS